MKTSIYLLISILLVCSSCDFGDNRLIIVNNSDNDIYIHYSCDSTLDDLKILRNGYYKNNRGDSTYVISDNYIKVDAHNNIPQWGLNAWPRYINECRNKTLYIFFFTDSLVENHSVDEIRKMKIYSDLKKYSYKDLTRIKWTVVYP